MCDNSNDNENNELNKTKFEKLIKNVIQLSIDNQSVSYSFPRLFDDSNNPSILQSSLFPFVSPTIYFGLENESSIHSFIHSLINYYLKHK
jgi:hypothetical protein